MPVPVSARCGTAQESASRRPWCMLVVMPATRQRCTGFTLIELLMVLGIVTALMALLIGAVGVLRGKARTSQAQAMILGLVAAVETYAAEDVVQRFPLHESLFVPAAAPAYEVGRAALPGVHPDGLIGLLSVRKPFAQDGSRFDEAGRLLDPWGRPYRYHLRRPAPGQHAERLQDWNWDLARSRERSWSQAADAAAPYPYIWSLGPDGAADDAAGWIYAAR